MTTIQPPVLRPEGRGQRVIISNTGLQVEVGAVREWNPKDADADYNITEDALTGQTVWTLGKGCYRGDVILFSLAYNTDKAIRHVRTEAKKDIRAFREGLYDDDPAMSDEEVLDRVNQHFEFVQKHWKKVFAIGVLENNCRGNETVEISHLALLENPIDVSEFANVQKLSKTSSITYVKDDCLEVIKGLMSPSDRAMFDEREYIGQRMIEQENDEDMLGLLDMVFSDSDAVLGLGSKNTDNDKSLKWLDDLLGI